MTTENFDHWELYIDEASRIAELIGKVLIVGVTELKPTGDVANRDQYFGKILKIGPKDGVEIYCDAYDKIFWLPVDYTKFQTMAPGHYRLRTRGEIVVNPDFCVTTEIHNIY